MTNRVMDLIQEQINKLQNLYANLKKLAQDRRGQSNLMQFENQRRELWDSISKHHETIMLHQPPDGYEQKFKDIREVNDKFKNKLIEFGFVSDNIDQSNPAAANPEIKSMMQEMFKQFREMQSTQFEQLQLQINSLKEHQEESTKIRQPPLQDSSNSHAESSSNPTQKDNNKPTIESDTTVHLMRLLARQTYQNLPVFTGSYQEWPTFISYYNSTKDSFTDIENHGRLINSLQGDAKYSVQSLLIDPHNVNAVMEMLKFQYGRPETLIRTLMSKVRTFKPISDHEWKAQIHLATEVKNLCSSIQNSGAVAHLNNPLLIDEIIGKLSSNKQVAWHRFRIKSGIGEPNIKDLSDWLISESKPLNSLLDTQIIYNQHQTQQSSSSSSKRNSTEKHQSNVSRVHVTQDSKVREKALNCFICKSNEHSTLTCMTFTTSSDKLGLMKLYKLCIFCGKHRYNKLLPCRSREYLRCQKCNGKHVTELHYDKPTAVSSHNSPEMSVSDHPTTSSRALNNKVSMECLLENQKPKFDIQATQNFVTSQTTTTCSLMPTAIANIVIGTHQTVPVRVIIDQCSERSYISKRLSNVLKLKRYKSNEIVKGINNITTEAAHYTEFKIRFKDTSLDDLKVSAIILPEITGHLPSVDVPENEFLINIPLADPGHRTPGKVEVLLGNDICYRIFKNNESVKVTENGLIYQNTNFGWIVSGRVASKHNMSRGISTFITLSESNIRVKNDASLYKQLMIFYELPETCENELEDSDYCENLFTKMHYRQHDGRYVVPVPWKPDAPQLGSSYLLARSCFLSQERKWQNNPTLLEKTTKFMRDYFEMGHMLPIPDHEHRDLTNNVCYIPYLSILREDSYTTKLRNVFNASAKTSNGVSLNDTMYDGEKLQTKIFDIITRSRSFKYIYSADITKMFRQIMILPSDSEKMRIVWRHSPLVPFNEFKLTTVTYGTDAAPWQAIRTIHQCASDNSPSSEIAEIIKNSFYVDDLLHGGDTIEQCQQQIDGIIQTMNSGCFPLTKWMSNKKEILSNIPASDQISVYLNAPIDQIKILGLIYDPESDQYMINIKYDNIIIYTKRGIASVAAKFYDPVGFILPFIMQLRIFLKTVWAENVDWDEALSDNTCQMFDRCLENVHMLKSIRIPRWIGSEFMTTIELIGFSDASDKGQAAVIYSRVKSGDNYIIRLIAAKGNVTKLKTPKVLESKQQTIPKLELQAILTLVNLYDSIKICFQHKNIKFKAYTDSLIALSWVRNNNTGQKFIRRKVGQIRRIINSDQINYVSTHENPADVASRGLKPNKLAKCDLYYNGPDWLQHDELPITSLNSEDDKSNCLITRTKDSDEDMFEKFSNFMFLIRVVALILRWKRYKKSISGCYERYLNSNDGKLYFRFNADEISHAKQGIIKYYQRLHFKSIITNLEDKIQILVPKGHWLYKLSPFLDENEIIRIGGRLNYADAPANLKNPIAVPQSHLKSLIISYCHLSNLHASNSLMLRLINETYWIPALRSSIHHFIQKCTVCSRWRNQRIQPQMSHLPSVRVNRAQPFEHCGVDLAGPFEIKSSTLRQAKIIKVWIVTFVCMSTKALHLEVTSSLDTEHFLAAFDRFTSRRGVPRQVWSDNGKNFIGANRLLTEAWHRLSLQCQSLLATQEIKWVFIPRYSPSFGGLWEASVKSIKYFTHRMRDIRNLTFEEFNTLLCKIEALLNSRPITTSPISPFEEAPLTPFHFLTQKGMTTDSISATGVENSPLKKKWLEIVKIQRHLWKRFQTEYLTQLQKKAKWIRKDRELSKGELVLISDNNTSPGEWRTGRIEKTYQDSQGVARKADIKHSNGRISVESIKNLVPLNILDAEEQLPKQSTRSNGISTTQVLLVWLACTAGTQAFDTTILDSGVHLFQLKNVFIKAIDLEFIVNTGFNLTSDIATINNQISKFEEFCSHIVATKPIESHCNNMLKLIKLDASELSNLLINTFNATKRHKRYVQLGKLSIQASKFLFKHSPEIVMGVGLAWQGYEIAELEAKAKEADNRLKLATEAIIQIMKTEEKDLETNLKNLKRTQYEEHLLQTTNSYSEVLNTILSTLSNKYRQLASIKPKEELNTYIQELQKQSVYNDFILPDMENIFEDINYKVSNDTVVLVYTIPLVQRTPMQRYALISVPNSQNEAIQLPSKTKVMIILVDYKQQSYAVPTNNELEIFEDIKWLPLEFCLQSILQHDGNGTAETCNLDVDTSRTDEIIKLNKTLAVVFTYTKVTSLICGDESFTYSQSYLLINTYPNCIIELNGVKFGQLYEEIRLAPIQNLPAVTIPIINSTKLVNHKKKINDLYLTAEHAVKSRIEPWHLGAGGITIILAFVFLIISIIRCRLRCKQREPWFPHWHGPAVEDADTDL